MNEDELRALIRDAVARHLGHAGDEPPRPPLPSRRVGAPAVRAGAGAVHPSQVIYLSLVNAGDACLIEPAVTCTHCGYCKTHGY